MAARRDRAVACRDGGESAGSRLVSPRAGQRSRGDPLAGVERVLVDGSNLAHALVRGRRPGPAGPGPTAQSASPLPTSAVVASLRAAFPPAVRVEVMFDGPGTPQRVASNLFVEPAGRRSADQVIVEAVEAQLRLDGPAGTWGILVVTDDRELRGLVQARGARIAGASWLAGRLAASAAGIGPARPRAGASIGNRRPPRPAPPR